MRVIFPFAGDSIGGSQISSINIYKNLVDKKIDTFFVIHKKGNFKDYLDNYKIRYKFLPIKNLAGENPSKFKILIRILLNFYKIYRFILKNKIDIIHCNTLSTNLTWSIPVIISKKKIIWHQRQPLSKSFFWGFVKYLSNIVIANSQYVMSTLPSNIKKKKLIYNSFYNFNFISKKNGKEYLYKKYNISNDQILIGFVGRLEESKDILYTLNAINNLNKIKNIHFIFIGQQKKDYQFKIDNFIKKKSINNIITVANFDSNNLQIIAGLDVFISSSKNEAFGRSIVESMLLKTLVICSNNGSHKELIDNKETGYLFNKDNINNLTDLIMHVSTSPKNNNHLIEKAYRNAKKKFCRYDSNNLIIDIYKKLLI